MASTRKTRNVNRRFGKYSDELTEKEPVGSQRGKERKKKISDLLGSPWSKEELENFYESYRKHGKDWKKVASTLLNRTPEMVEALYNMNRAYLSLPEGIASAAGLIAMMTDHYNILDGSHSDRESLELTRASRRPLKRGRTKFKMMSNDSALHSPDLLQHQSTSSNHGCLSLLNAESLNDPFIRNKQRAVGKRTPRVPILNMNHRDDRSKMPFGSKILKSDDKADDEGAHDAALALAEVLQRGGSPQFSRTPGRYSDHVGFSPAKSSEKKNADSDMGSSKHHGFQLDGDYPECSLGSREAENAVSKDVSCSVPNKGYALEGSQQKLKRSKRRRQKACHPGEQFNDDREACSGTEEGHSGKKVKDDADSGALEANTNWGSNSSKKRSRQLVFEDDNSGLDALLTLADLSVNILQPVGGLESESSAQVKDEMKGNDSDGRPTGTIEGSNHQERENSSSLIRRDRIHADNTNTDFATRKKGKQSRKSSSARVLKDVPTIDTLKDDLEKTEASCVKDICSLTETVNKEDMQLKSRSRRKASTSKPRSREVILNESYQYWNSDRFINSVNCIADIKEKLSHSLVSRLFRRWCMYEWFYSAIDFPWFVKSEFVEYLNHVKLGHIPKLTRVEWGVIRSSLGKPRRLSRLFLKEEREKLAQYRESVRMHYAELRTGFSEGLPADLGRPFSVGQHIIAQHPKTGELQDGIVLAVDYNHCKVQFDHPEIGVEIVMDINCMSVHQSENIPECFKNQNLLNIFCNSSLDMRLGPRQKEWKVGTQVDTIDAIIKAKATVHEVTVAAQQATYNQPCTLSQIQEREADIRALADLTRALDKKEALLLELRHMNEEVAVKKNGGDAIGDIEHFRKQYAMVLVQLRDANDQVSSALVSLRQRNTYDGNSKHSFTSTTRYRGALDSYNAEAILDQKLESQVMEITEDSRRKARMMVDCAIEAMCKENADDAFVKIGEALDNLNTRCFGSGSSILGIRRIPPDSGPANSLYHDTLRCSFDLRGSHPSNNNDLQSPSELVLSCVATLLMIQSCAERQYPPAAIAHLLDSAVLSLRSCCSKNLPVLRDIETCMGIIKNQMLALVPTPNAYTEVAIL